MPPKKARLSQHGKLVHQSSKSPQEIELAVSAANRTSIRKWAEKARKETPECTDTECIRCKNHISTYTLCSACDLLVPNFYEIGVLTRTPYMLEQAKKNKGYNAKSDEISKSRMFWIMLMKPSGK